MAGFEVDDDRNQQWKPPPTWQAEIERFPEYYEGHLTRYSKTVAPIRPIKCVGPVGYAGHDALQTDIDNLEAAVAGHGDRVTEVFMPATTPGSYGRNEYYDDPDELREAVAAAMREELALADVAPFILRIDAGA